MNDRSPDERLPGRHHVAFLHPSPDGLGGSQGSMLVEARGLVEAGWTVDLVHAQDDLGPTTAGLFAAAVAIPDLFGNRPGRRLLRAVRSLERFLDDRGPAVVHAHLWSSAIVLARLVGRGPTVVTCHLPVCPNGARFQYGTGHLCDRDVGVGCLTVGHRTLGCGSTADEVPFGAAPFAAALADAHWTLRQLGRCAAVVAPSAWQRDRLVADGVPADRIVVLPPPIAPRPGPGTRQSHATSVVLGAGRLMVLKGFDHLLRASAASVLEHELHLAGDGPALAGLRRLAGELGIADRVRFLGALSSEDLDAAVHRSSVVVMPSVWPETFGMVGAEALLAGAPVVAYCSGGASDWARPEFGAVAVPTGSVARLASSIDDALAAGDTARPTSEQRAALGALLSPRRHADVLVGVYEGLA